MANGDMFEICKRCSGTGTVISQHDTDGNAVIENPCQACNGSGKIKTGGIDTTDIMADLDKCKKRLKKIMDKLEITD